MKDITNDTRPHQTVIITADMWEKLPSEAHEDLRFYIGTPVRNTATGQSGYRFSLPAYLVEQINEHYQE